MSRSRPEAPTWEEISAPFGAAVEAYFRERGSDPDSATVRSTVRTNTELVPRRGENLLHLVRELAGVSSLDGLDVLEAGCGFGALAAYLAWSQQPRSVLAIDVRSDYVASGRHSARTAGLDDRLAYGEADMRRFEGVRDGSADLVLLNNAFIYLPTAADMRAALGSLRRVTAPGGHVVLYHANRWQLREPFTRDPLVHLLPPALGRRLGNMTGWRHNHGRVRLVSPVELGVRLRAAGFDQVRLGAIGRGQQVVRAPKALGASFYGLAARRR